MQGYYYLRDAVIAVKYNGYLIKNAEKNLFPIIANNYNISTYRVNWCIRNAANTIWSTIDNEILKKNLGINHKPSCIELIKLLSK
jgi:hypothetical protein